MWERKRKSRTTIILLRLNFKYRGKTNFSILRERNALKVDDILFFPLTLSVKFKMTEKQQQLQQQKKEKNNSSLCLVLCFLIKPFTSFHQCFTYDWKHFVFDVHVLNISCMFCIACTHSKIFTQSYIIFFLCIYLFIFLFVSICAVAVYSSSLHFSYIHLILPSSYMCYTKLPHYTTHNTRLDMCIWLKKLKEQQLHQQH